MATSLGPALTLVFAMGVAGTSSSPVLARDETPKGCPDVLAIPRAMKIGTQYAKGDASYSRLDPQAVAREKITRAGISGPVTRIAQLADRWRIADNRQRPAIAECLGRHFRAQASAEALMGAQSIYDAYYREWMLASLAISYIKAKPGLDRQPGSDRIQAWLRTSGQQIKQFNEGQLRQGRIDNHRYWGALASMAIGLAVGDAELVAFGRNTRAIGLAAVRKDGTLASEMKRQSLAFHYHLFAGSALAALATFDPKAASADEILAMQRLTGAIIEHMRHPKDNVFVATTGVLQAEETHRAMAYMLYPYVTSSVDRAELDRFLAGIPKGYQFLGGDLSCLVWRAPAGHSSCAGR